MKKNFFLGACLVALASSPVQAQANGADIALVRISETQAHLVVVRPGGKTTEVAFNAGSTKKALAEGGQTIQTVLESLYQEGYELKSTYTAGFLTTLMLVRRKQ